MILLNDDDGDAENQPHHYRSHTYPDEGHEGHTQLMGPSSHRNTADLHDCDTRMYLEVLISNQLSTESLETYQLG